MHTGRGSGWGDRRGRRFSRRPVCELMERRQLLATFTVANTSDNTNPNSLRWAILQANASQTASVIDFDLGASGTATINLTSPLPSLQVSVLIDGTTEPGYQDTPLVEIDGSALGGGGNDGLVLAAGGSTIRGLSLVGFSDSAIVLMSQGDDAIVGNYLGLDPSGAAAIPNQQGIALLGTSDNTIGAGTAGGGNVISGNSGDGILIENGGGDSGGNLITGNWIGTTADGSAAIGNGGAGIAVAGADANTIGLPIQGFGNFISGNVGPGIKITGGADGTAIQNNVIGLAADGTSPIGNEGDGIQLDDAPGTLIGGTDLGDGNVISANLGNGIDTSGDTAQLWVAGNEIGTDATGQLALGNQQNGINLASSTNSIGGTVAGASNIIEYNGTGKVGAGVQLVGMVDQDSILSNSIYANAGLGINLGSGPTPDHSPGTPGPNAYQNYPILSSAQSNGSSLTVQGTLFESPGNSYLIQFFSSPEEGRFGFGQGKVLLGSMNVQADAKGHASFTASLPAVGPSGAYISATATDGSGDTSEFSADLAVQGPINLVLSGAATPDPVLAGQTFTYTIDLDNQGLTDADGVTLTDPLPAGFTLESVTVQGNSVPPTTIGGSLNVPLGTIAAGSSVTVLINMQAGADSVGTITNTVSITSTNPGSIAEQLSIPVTVESNADMSVALTDSPSPALAGGDLTYTMTVTDNGPDGAANVVATLPVAAGLSLVSVTTDTGQVAFTGGQVTADLGEMLPGTQAVVTVVFQTSAAGSVSETATVSSNALDPNPSNNTSTLVTQVEPASDLAVTVYADTDVVAVGEPFEYTVTVTNNGPSDATDVVLSDSLPAGATFVSDSTDQAASTVVAGGVVSLDLDTLASGDTATLWIVVTPTASPGSKLVDSANAQGQQADPNTANNSASLSLPVRGVSDLSVTGSVQPGSGYVGQPMTYTIDVTNQGPNDEPDAVLSSNLPLGLVVDSTGSTQGADPPVSQGILTADLGLLPAGATAVVTLVVTPGPSDVGPLTTAFSVQGLDYDPDATNNTAYVTNSVVATSDLGVVIAPSSGPAMAQVDWSYSVLVTNNGPSTATGVVATIPLPGGVQLASASSGQGSTPTQQGGVLTDDLGDIASGGSATITIVIDPTPASSGTSISLSAEVAGNQFDPNPANNQASLNLAIDPSVDVALNLSSTPQVVQSGQMVIFTASVSNVGSTPATDVLVTFPSVSGLTLLSSSPSQGTMALVSGQYFARLGDLGPGSSATITMMAMATTPGMFTQTASVSETEYNLDLPDASASISAQVVESAGTVEFGAGQYEVTDQSGVAVIPVVRLYGSLGTVTVTYQTVSVNAIPGLDFTPTSGTLTLGPGQTSGSIQVPVLDDPYQDQDHFLNVTLANPTGGASLGATTSTLLHIQDVDPDVTAPVVDGLTWSGSSRSITSLTLTFSAPLDPSYATDPADYRLFKISRGQSIPIASISYDAANFSVTIVPQSPIPSGQYAEIQVIGTGPGALRDIAGNILDGADNGVPGSNYAAMFAQGNRLKYTDNNGNSVKLRLRGPGYLEQILDAIGEGISLNVEGMAPHRTTLTGSIKSRHRRGGGQTELGTLSGLGQFGDVKVLLKTPPFRVSQLPFQRRGRSIL